MSKPNRLSGSPKHRWRGLLLSIGIDPARARADDVLAFLERQQFQAEIIAEVLRLFFPGPDAEPGPNAFRPQTSITREARVEILRQRVQAKLPPCHPEDIVRGMLDDHVDHAPEGKPLVSWYDVELMAELEEEVASLDYLDEVPRERTRRWMERTDRHRGTLGFRVA